MMLCCDRIMLYTQLRLTQAIASLAFFNPKRPPFSPLIFPFGTSRVVVHPWFDFQDAGNLLQS